MNDSTTKSHFKGINLAKDDRYTNLYHHHTCHCRCAEIQSLYPRLFEVRNPYAPISPPCSRGSLSGFFSGCRLTPEPHKQKWSTREFFRQKSDHLFSQRLKSHDAKTRIQFTCPCLDPINSLVFWSTNIWKLPCEILKVRMRLLRINSDSNVLSRSYLKKI